MQQQTMQDLGKKDHPAYVSTKKIIDALRTNTNPKHYTTLIGSGYDFRALLEYDKLTDEEFTRVLADMKGKLGPLFACQDDRALRDHLFERLKLSPERLNQLWEMMKDDFATVVQNANHLAFVLMSNGHTEQFRDQMWEAVQDKLPTLIQNLRQFCSLMNCPYVWEVRRSEQAWKAGTEHGKLRALLTILVSDEKTGSLMNLFSMYEPNSSINRINEDQCKTLWATVQEMDSLASLIKDVMELQYLLQHTSLERNDKIKIANAVINNPEALTRFIEGAQYVSDVQNLLSNSILTDGHRNRIVSALTKKSDLAKFFNIEKQSDFALHQTFRGTGYSLEPRQSLTEFLKIGQLTDDHRTQILVALRAQLKICIPDSRKCEQFMEENGYKAALDPTTFNNQAKAFCSSMKKYISSPAISAPSIFTNPKKKTGHDNNNQQEMNTFSAPQNQN